MPLFNLVSSSRALVLIAGYLKHKRLPSSLVIRCNSLARVVFLLLFWFTQNVINRENSFYECERSTNCVELFAENVDGNKTKHRGERRARIL